MPSATYRIPKQAVPTGIVDDTYMLVSIDETTGILTITYISSTGVRTVSVLPNGQMDPPSANPGVAPNGQMNIWIDEAANILRFNVTYAAGTTKTTTLALV